MPEVNQELDVLVETPETPEPTPVETPDVDAESEEPELPAQPTATVPMSELRKVRAEAANYRKKLRALEERQKEEKHTAELAKMEETDRLKAIATEAEARAKTLKARADRTAKESAIISAASAMNFRIPKHAAKLLDLDDLDIDDNGKVDPALVKEGLEALAEEDPLLIKQPEVAPQPVSIGGGPSNPAPEEDYVPMPKFTDEKQKQRMLDQAQALRDSGDVVKGVRMRQQILRSTSGPAVQAERTGKKIR